ncbi:MAG: biotin/lipoyl-binding protein, partial [Puniceicoccaceae bacterium]
MFKSSSTQPAEQSWSARKFMRLGLVTASILVISVGGWSAFASINGAVLAEGRLKVQGERQVVQHLNGGIVTELNVREGDTVQAGDVVLRLDGRRVEGELSIVTNQLQEVLARIARLEAEQAGVAATEFPAELISVAAADEEVAAILQGQERLFQARLDRLHREQD